MPFYERGDVRISYEEVGSGFPLLAMPGGGLNSLMSGWPRSPGTYLAAERSMRGAWVEVRRRLGVHALVILGVWPLLSLLMAAVEIRELPYYAVSPGQALLGAAAGTAVLLPDFALVGALALAVSSLCFGLLATARLLPTTSRREIAVEPVLLFLAAYFGIALCYPSVLANPLLTFARAYPVLPVTIALAAVAAGAFFPSPASACSISALAAARCGSSCSSSMRSTSRARAR